MNKLFDDSEVYQKERPKGITEAQLEQLYADIAQEIIDEEYSTASKNDIIKDIRNISFMDSGYEIAKSLERSFNCEYDFSLDFIEYLDNLSWKRQEIKDKNVQDWVKAVKPQPKYEKSQILMCIDNVSHSYKKDEIIYINGYDKKEARYYVSTQCNSNRNTIIDIEIIEEKCRIATEEELIAENAKGLPF